MGLKRSHAPVLDGRIACFNRLADSNGTLQNATDTTERQNHEEAQLTSNTNGAARADSLREVGMDALSATANSDRDK